MPQPDDPQAKLEAALIAAADALAQLPQSEWQALCREEALDLVMTMQYFEVHGVPDSFPPERTIGRRVIEHLAARHPLALDPVGQA